MDTHRVAHKIIYFRKRELKRKMDRSKDDDDDDDWRSGAEQNERDKIYQI